MSDDQYHLDSVPPTHSILAEIAELVRFFSRIPLPKLGKWDSLEKLPDFSTSTRSIALAGIIISLPSMLVLFILSLGSLPGPVIALLAVATAAAVQGCLHEDGMADVVDGFFGGHTAERRLEIMKDSRIGAFGTVALVLSLSLRWLLLSVLLEVFGGAGAALGFLAAETTGRLGMVWIWHKIPAAYQGGLSTRFGVPKNIAVYWATLFALLPLALCLFYLSFGQVVMGVLVGLLLVWVLARLSRAKIKGITGDVLGAAQQIGSIGFLLGAFIL
ncbi:Cobalamin synthase [Pseudovibrio axinellae]|uniref:Adenosylcobinamide-GDP ribazoletransferase n=1 Tax=Pseudovibrio axinellae TaxID=989403 RepID=A0A166AH88_9HYPH|nr:adenosylcobinamide-GDP ribazoletransferase [Pseudovibrio axinellae]KZL21066.1 Cobalamin synthase [Pseudovibrio axinellae]SEP76729.1 cobalamin-5'-phosphate synthase [Pseudovibrio axinellae]